MNNKNYDYTLDFVIPVGPTGPTGSTGPASLISLITRCYNNTSSAGLLTIQSNPLNIILPVNSNFFTMDNNTIVINNDGYYEFVFYGILEDNITTEEASLVLKINNENLITINLNAESNSLNFSQTIVAHCNPSQRVSIQFNKSDNSNASVENIYLIIKKLYF